MASTSHGIPLADGSTEVDPIQTPLNAIANALDNALTAIVEELTNAQGYFSGTQSERLALTAPKLRNGIKWGETPSGIEYTRIGGQWIVTTPVVNLGSVKNTTTLQTGISTTPVELSGISLSVTLPTSAKLRFLVNVHTESTSPGDSVYILIRNDTTVIAKAPRAANSSPTTAGNGTSSTMAAEATLPAGTHRLNVALQRAFGSGTIKTAPNATEMNLLSIDRIGE